MWKGPRKVEDYRDVERPTKSRRLVNSKSSCPTTHEFLSFNDGNLPDWLLIEVLCRLPIKSIFRFKCVSKCWNSIISHPSFRRFYISRASASALPWGFLLKRIHVEGSKMANFPKHKLLENKISDGTLLSSPHASVLALPNSHKAKGPLYYIKAADNGVVLYGWFDLDRRSFNDATEYFICNPITKQWLAIPDPKHCTRRASFGFITQVDEEGILRSFKLVLVHCPCTSKIQNFLEFEVFSSETGKWVEHIVHSPCTVRVSHNKKAFVMEGNLHWDDCELGVIAYDPYNSPDKFRIIEFPHVDTEGNKSRYMCGGHLGRLKYFEVGRMFKPQGFSHLKIWALEDYSSNNWYLQHIVRKEDIMVDNNLGSSQHI
ncbi:hypothetical protein ACH5RR_038160 [Cinchona calisaya]|uniref:F-box domain-containing protein n=1 Tax=Cinchona calisaya TaxID=153742 RepID=A0ABD2YAL0_9GENT